MAIYNCTDSTGSAYGAGNYGICTVQAVGAPNTGVFSEFSGDGIFTLLLPVVVAVILAAGAGLLLRRRRKS